MGYNSWRDYLLGEFADMSYSYLTRQTKAAQLEAEVGVDIGTHKESHLRPIVETLDGDDMVTAYRMIDFDKSPISRDVQEIADRVRVEGSVYTPTIINMRMGRMTATAARQIINLLGQIDEEDIDALIVAMHVTDPDIIPILLRLAKANSETWQEIRSSLTIPAFPDPIPIERATATNLLAWLDVASAEHRAVAREKRRDYFDKLNAATDAIVDEIGRAHV